MLGQLCKTCKTVTAVLFLVVGALYLLTDLGLVAFWKINWWTSLFLIVAVTSIASSTCKNCQAMAKK